MTFDKQFVLNVGLPLAEAAYNVKSDTPALPAGFRILAIVRSPEYPFFGFVATGGATLFIVLRGTETPEEWLEDFDAQPINVGGFAVHAGFQRVFEAVLPSIRAALANAYLYSEICVIGHSLGAAVATLVAAALGEGTSLPVSCLVFASPRVGDDAFRERCAKVNLLRMVNTKDLVTHVPPRPLFIHAGKACVFDGWQYAQNIAQRLDAHFEHSLEFSYTPGARGMPDQLVGIELS